MSELDKGKLVAELAERSAIQINEHDPAFAIVALNQIVLEHAMDELGDAVGRRIAEFETSVLRVEQHAGKMLALEFSDAAARIRAELQADIETAGIKAAHLVYLVDQAHKRPALVRWLSAGLISALVLFIVGLWIGAHCLRP
jgi:hypothetical protein